MEPDVLHRVITPVANAKVSGKFSATEDALLEHTIADYCKNNLEMSQDSVRDIVFTNQKHRRSKSEPFWKAIYAALPQRDQHAVYNRTRRLLGFARQGPWMVNEDELLIKNVGALGQKWSQISKRVGRDPEACRARYVDHLRDKDVRFEGPWTVEEEVRLTVIVENQPHEQIKWDSVSNQMGRTRNRIQCREKWTALRKAKQNNGKQPRWSTRDTSILVEKLSSLALTDETAICWNTLTWDSWTDRDLRRHWHTFKEGIPEGMNFPEILSTIYKNTVDKNFIPRLATPPIRSDVESSETYAVADQCRSWQISAKREIGGDRKINKLC